MRRSRADPMRATGQQTAARTAIAAGDTEPPAQACPVTVSSTVVATKARARSRRSAPDPAPTMPGS